jgi:DNA modification methylase
LEKSFCIIRLDEYWKINLKQKRDRYEMHKYWGKKPSNDLKKLIEEFSKIGDTVFDPFAGYGVFCCEGLILNRNVISNDLNPIANFINKQLLDKSMDIELVKKQWKKIKAEFESFNHEWFKWEYEGEIVELISVLRSKDDIPVKAKFKKKGIAKAIEIHLEKESVNQFIQKENSFEIEDWYPDEKLIPNSRISAKVGMKVSDLFTKRTLACHAKLLSLIEKYSTNLELDLFRMAFTSNLANCSRLVPPIISRGEMSQGAWMTGFYTGETYIENNVLHYFENRLNKAIKGKLDYLQQFKNDKVSNFNPIEYKNSYKILQNDVKQLEIEDESIDYIFTDPPYGDAVPYFEQSIIWNSWLKFKPDYSEEIVVSDSKVRNKNISIFEEDINLAFAEIARVLKMGKFFSLTYHSLSGLEWKAITNACIKNGFDMYSFEWLVQKSFTPRQINRLKSVKGDVLVTLIKSDLPKDMCQRTDEDIKKLFISKITEWLMDNPLDTNEIFLKIMKMIFSEKILIGNVDLLKILTENFNFTDTQKWRIHE